ncbi:Stk1 family PASTA domain-containing Ser/Thr kinase [Actinacidiphila sp. DG2A-62]|uniref:Stk1 family PASTA domain-containing Ser/Thr kinase n=1 Tax=Actinacidiphila sp. DG2A-62 TaxID=3108821 RepID=UPI002DB7BD44|nr:Stk1 family PASTA domain-containing Ser/Thr kinase [Actinacidiphila sp. DG2A-62]MEC3995685.1 Stk1 family PASTA domain-containing Ser/Thr kinase [Actinacidiphila sp. DG2A-62]
MEEPRRLGGRYELGSVLGRGGMAEVYLAHDTRLGRTVAVKTLRVDLARDPSFQARFRREAQSAASLNHPSIVAVYDTGEDYVDGVSIPYIVMEYVDGSTLRELLHSGRKLLPERAMEMTVGILQALEYSHRAGIVHRDIKPANVMLTRTGQVKVMDFGIARAMGDSGMTMTQTAAVIGTAQYLSPEQAKGEQVDARSDLYSTGCLLYELLTVRPPFVGDSPVAVAYQHVREDPQPPSVFDPEVTPAMDAIVLKALTKDPDYRYQSADEMRADIEAALDGQPVGATVAMGAAGDGYPQPYGDGAATTALPAQGGDQHTTMLPPMREDDGGYGYDDRPDRRRQKKNNTSTVLLVIAGVLVLIGAIFLGKALFSKDSGGGSEAVPSFIGLSLPDAKAKAANVDLTITEGDAIDCPTVPLNMVGKQTPAANAPAPSDKQVTVQLCKGKPPADVPNVLHDEVNNAKQELINHGFTNITVKYKDSTTDDPNIVLAQDPSGGESKALNTKITLTVSKTPEKQTPVDVTGVPYDNAKAQLKAQGFTNVTRAQQDIPSDTTAKGSVVQQTPAPSDGAISLDTQIVLTVSSGPEQTQQPQQTMPDDLVSKTVGDAKAELNALGLNLQITAVGPDGNPVGDDARIYNVQPGAGSQLQEGQPVQLQAFGGGGGPGGGNGGGPGGGN